MCLEVQCELSQEVIEESRAVQCVNLPGRPAVCAFSVSSSPSGPESWLAGVLRSCGLMKTPAHTGPRVGGRDSLGVHTGVSRKKPP